MELLKKSVELLKKNLAESTEVEKKMFIDEINSYGFHGPSFEEYLEGLSTVSSIMVSDLYKESEEEVICETVVNVRPQIPEIKIINSSVSKFVSGKFYDSYSTKEPKDKSVIYENAA